MGTLISKKGMNLYLALNVKTAIELHEYYIFNADCQTFVSLYLKLYDNACYSEADILNIKVKLHR